jgi:hypothetical protein
LNEPILCFCVHVCLNRGMRKKENEKEEDVKEGDDHELRERRCFQCGDMGHVRRDCQEYRHLRQRAAVGLGTHTHTPDRGCIR